MIRDRFRQLARRSDALLAATSPIYAQDADGGIEGVGTGVFFRHLGKHFVLSAAHVLRRLKKEQLLIGSDHLIPINGRYFVSKSDDVDLGFIPLSDAQVTELKGGVFLTIDDIDLSDDPEMLIEHSETHKLVVSTRLGPLLDAVADHVSGLLRYRPSRPSPRQLRFRRQSELLRIHHAIAVLL